MGHATVHSTALFTILIDLQPWPSTPFAFSSAAPRSPCVACPIHGLLGLLLRSSGAVGSSIEVTAARTSNARVCLIIIRCRHCARLSFIVLHRLLFVDQYFRRASGSRGSGRCLHMAWAWPERGKRRGRPGKAGEASFGRALPALRWAMHCMCSLERNFECTGGPWRPRLGSFALLASL